jgi:hypothetical protein
VVVGLIVAALAVAQFFQLCHSEERSDEEPFDFAQGGLCCLPAASQEQEKSRFLVVPLRSTSRNDIGWEGL